MSKLLTMVGHTVTAFNDPLLALQESQHTAFDLVVSDVVMPGLSGIELVLKVRTLQPACKVILLSGQASTPDLLAKAGGKGSEFEILRKPIMPEDLLRLVESTAQTPSA